jgi:hypothetical protein
LLLVADVGHAADFLHYVALVARTQITPVACDNALCRRGGVPFVPQSLTVLFADKWTRRAVLRVSHELCVTMPDHPNPNPNPNPSARTLHQDARGEVYWWSEAERCYVFQSGRRVDTGGRQLQAPLPAQGVQVPRSQIT